MGAVQSSIGAITVVLPSLFTIALVTITAALFEFATKGYQGFVINELCKVDGIAKGVLYHNFSGKSDLYLTWFQDMNINYHRFWI